MRDEMANELKRAFVMELLYFFQKHLDITGDNEISIKCLNDDQISYDIQELTDKLVDLSNDYCLEFFREATDAIFNYGLA